MIDELNKDAKALENAFFKKHNDRLVQELKAKAQREEKKKALREIMPKADDGLLSHLVDLGLGPSTVLAVGTVPLVAVAWADGDLDGKERDAILRAASERGIKTGTPDYTMLELWLSEKPGPSLMEAWKHYMAAIWAELTPAERREVRHALLERAKQVAKAAGGFLGLGSISREEEAVLKELEASLPL